MPLLLPQNQIASMEETHNISFRNFATLEEAEEIASVLRKHHVNSKITKDSGDLDYVLLGEAPVNKYELQIREDDHQLAESILTEIAKENLDHIQKDYYLFSFTDAELIDILIKKNEWSEFDVLLCEKILAERGVDVNLAEIDKKRELRDLALQQPEGGQTGWIIAGYIAAIFGGFFGILLGYSLWLSKKKLSNGKKVPAYNEDVRSQGKIIFYLGFVMFIILNILRLKKMLTLF